MRHGKIDKQRLFERIATLVKEDWLATGVTEEEWQQMMLISEIEDKLLAAGLTIEEINEEWRDLKPEYILGKYSYLLKEVKRPQKTRSATYTDWLPVSFREFVQDPEPHLLYHVHLTLRGGHIEEYDQEALVIRRELREVLARLKSSQQVEIQLLILFDQDHPPILFDIRIPQIQMKGESPIRSRKWRG